MSESNNDNNDYNEIMLKYQFAMQRLETELDILIKEYAFRNSYNPVEHVKTRIKSMNSILDKLKRKDLEVSPTNILRNIHDVVGVRIICSFLSDVQTIVSIIKSSKQFIIIEENDYIKNPKTTGYSSYHLNILVPVHLFDIVEYVEAEIQIRTVAMDCWASLDHKLQYKLPQEIPEEIKKDMSIKAAEMRQLDQSMQRLYDIIKNYKTN